MERTDQEQQQRWQRLLSAQGASPDLVDRTFDDLVRRYRAADRHYHTLDHIVTVLDTLDLLCTASPPALLLAAWLHDVIYDSRASDNEERSADYTRGLREPLGLDESLTDEAARLILLTRTHQTTTEDVPGQLLLDADLVILGASPEEYHRYAQAIRREYAWVPEDLYRKGRAGVLERFMERPRLYYTASLHERAEPQARRNLLAELQSLRS
jgi:predicted metal-dependent HD superfamily phosphohydrolase